MKMFGGELDEELGPHAPDNASASEQEPDMPKSPTQQDGSTGNAKTCGSVILIVNDIVHLA